MTNNLGKNKQSELFATESKYCAYYKYFGKQNTHEFILDLKAITYDVFARNKTFLDILKGNH